MTSEQRAELRKLADAATAGPWRPSDDDPEDVVVWGPARDQWTANVGDWGDLNGATGVTLHQIAEAHAADAAFIAAARTAIPDLLDALDASEARVLELEGALERFTKEEWLDSDTFACVFCGFRPHAADCFWKAARALSPTGEERA